MTGMGNTQRHVTTIHPDHACDFFPQIRMTFLASLFKFARPPFLLASYSYGDQIASWCYQNRTSFRLFTPCGPNKQPCYECKELLAACSEGPPLIFLIKRSVEIFANTSIYGSNEQAPSVPLQILSPGDPIGFIETSLALFGKNKAVNGIAATSRNVAAAAGARSVYLTVPMNDSDLNSTIRSLPGAKEAGKMNSRDFEDDHWLPLRSLSAALKKSKASHDQWCVEVLIIPHRAIRDALKKQPSLRIELLVAAFEESATKLCLAKTGKEFTEEKCSYIKNREVRAHISELTQIITNQRLGFGPASDDSLGPFSDIQEFIADTHLMKTRTLAERMPAIIVPKTFDFNGQRPDFCYYSLRRPAIQTKFEEPGRVSRTISSLREEINQVVSEDSIAFFSSERPPNVEDLKISAVFGSERLNKDFSKQLDLAESKFGLKKTTVLGNPRSGFLASFIRLSNEAKVEETKSAEEESAADQKWLNGLYSELPQEQLGI